MNASASARVGSSPSAFWSFAMAVMMLLMSSSALIESERPPRSASGAPRSTAVRAIGAKPDEAESRANIGLSRRGAAMSFLSDCRRSRT